MGHDDDDAQVRAYDGRNGETIQLQWVQEEVSIEDGGGLRTTVYSSSR